MIEPHHQEVEVAGCRTDCFTYAEGVPGGPVMILVHGFRGDHHGLARIAEELAAAGGPYRIVAPDLPGFGSSEPFPDRPHDLSAYASWLTGFTTAVAGGRPVIMVGHSFGSIVVSAALAGGLAAERAVLINPIGAPALSGPRGFLSRLAVGYYWLGAKLPAPIGLPLLRSRAITRLLSEVMAKTKDPELRRWIHDQHRQYFGAFADRDVVLESFRASVSSDVSQFAAELDLPVLLIAGEVDDITEVDRQRVLADRFPRAELVVAEGVGHLIHYEAPALAAEAIGAFAGHTHGVAGPES
ncbi:alpha/beta fold hydrolase [Microlunatus sp. GCM10028923]|uniref:alpha/beta fold hydrolase n=1 Tax=Microlunatus sp. GCM10028923 TaxID=3273400 RepID=UPI00360B58B5